MLKIINLGIDKNLLCGQADTGERREYYWAILRLSLTRKMQKLLTSYKIQVLPNCKIARLYPYTNLVKRAGFRGTWLLKFFRTRVAASMISNFGRKMAASSRIWLIQAGLTSGTFHPLYSGSIFAEGPWFPKTRSWRLVIALTTGFQPSKWF